LYALELFVLPFYLLLAGDAYLPLKYFYNFAVVELIIFSESTRTITPEKCFYAVQNLHR